MSKKAVLSHLKEVKNVLVLTNKRVERGTFDVVLNKVDGERIAKMQQVLQETGVCLEELESSKPSEIEEKFEKLSTCVTKLQGFGTTVGNVLEILEPEVSYETQIVNLEKDVDFLALKVHGLTMKLEREKKVPKEKEHGQREDEDEDEEEHEDEEET